MINDHPALGNLSLDFRDSTGKANKTVILAGENGCGKTAILETIFKALGPPSALSRLEGERTRATVFIEPDEDIPEILDQNFVAMGDIPFDDDWIAFNGFAVRIFQNLTETEAAFGDRYIFNMRKKMD